MRQKNYINKTRDIEKFWEWSFLAAFFRGVFRGCLLVFAVAFFCGLFLMGCSDDDSSSGADGALDAAVSDGMMPDGAQGDASVEDGDTQTDGDTDGAVTPPECGEIVTFEQDLQPATVIHVATDGSDTQGDGSEGSPYATIQHAAGEVGPGEAVRVHQGTYEEGIYVSDLSGEAGSPIWIGGAPGETPPHVDASGESEALHLTRVSYLVIHDMELSGSSGNGINCDDGGDYSNETATHHVIFRNLYIHDIGTGGNQDCLKLSGLNNYFVLESEITACGGGGSGSAIDHVGCHHGLIAKNYLHHLSGNAVQSKGGSQDIEIRWNHIVDAGERGLNMGGSTGFEFFRPPLSTTTPNTEARDIRAVANVFEGSIAPIAFVGCVECLAANNTIIEPDNWIFRILQETTTSGDYEFLPCRDNTFVNNLVYFQRGDLSVHVNVGPNTDAESFIFQTNLWYAADDPQGGSEPNLPSQETGGIVGQDPSFISGFEIDSTSPAAGAGTTVTGIVTGDMNGACYAEPPSIGAYEVGD